jgi:hypothetical protein
MFAWSIATFRLFSTHNENRGYTTIRNDISIIAAILSESLAEKSMLYNVLNQTSMFGCKKMRFKRE